MYSLKYIGISQPYDLRNNKYLYIKLSINVELINKIFFRPLMLTKWELENRDNRYWEEKGIGKLISELFMESE